MTISSCQVRKQVRKGRLLCDPVEPLGRGSSTQLAVTAQEEQLFYSRWRSHIFKARNTALCLSPKLPSGLTTFILEVVVGMIARALQSANEFSKRYLICWTMLPYRASISLSWIPLASLQQTLRLRFEVQIKLLWYNVGMHLKLGQVDGESTGRGRPTMSCGCMTAKLDGTFKGLRGVWSTI